MTSIDRVGIGICLAASVLCLAYLHVINGYLGQHAECSQVCSARIEQLLLSTTDLAQQNARVLLALPELRQTDPHLDSVK
jgi:hypothetical protein